MLVTLFGIVTLVKDVQPSKVLSQMLVTLSGIVTLVRDVQLEKAPSYYKVVVIRVPLQGQNATIDKVLWIGLNLLPQDGFGKAPTTALCF